MNRLRGQIFFHQTKKCLNQFINRNKHQQNNNMTEGLELSVVVKKLDNFAPIKYAEKWDNVGLLIEPYTPRLIRHILLTNDLTGSVVKESIDQNVDFIISYHPPIFAPLKRITQSSWKERLVSMCLENRIALYSPHTAWDIVNGGVNDWLAKTFSFNSINPIQPHADNELIGSGRLLQLSKPIKLNDAINKVKNHLNLKHLNVAVGNNQTYESEINTVALCAGSGSSVLKGVKADLYLTGEMSHHEVLDLQEQGINVILSNHSNSERGFLNEFQQKFSNLIEEKIKISISKIDSDPLLIH